MTIDPTSHLTARFVNALQMVTQLVPYVDDHQLPLVVRLACIEAWYMNYRLLLEFFFHKPQKNCAGVESFLTSWKPSSPCPDDLGRDYGMTSADFAHIGNTRNRQTPATVSSSDLRPKAEVFLAVAEEFSLVLSAEDHDMADLIRIGVESARTSLSS